MISLVLARTELHRFAFRREDVDSVLLLPALYRRPGDIALVEGWLNLQGHGIPVISLASILGLEPEPPQLSDHLVLTVQLPRVAWRVRRVSGLGEVGWESLRLLEHSAEPTPSYVAEFDLDGEPFNLINVAGLLLAEEQQRLREAEHKLEERLRGVGPRG